MTIRCLRGTATALPPLHWFGVAFFVPAGGQHWVGGDTGLLTGCHQRTSSVVIDLKVFFIGPIVAVVVLSTMS